MRRYRRTEIQVGIFSIIAVLALVLGLLWMKEFRFARKYYDYKVTFTDTGGLIPGNTVMVSGFSKGEVNKMKLLDTGVEVDLAIERDVILHPDAKAFIGSRGLMGERYVEVARGTAPGTLPPGSMLQGEKQMGMAELMAGTGQLVESATLISADVQKIVRTLARSLDNDQMTGGLRDASAAATELRLLLESNRESFTTSVANFHRASESLARMTGKTEDDIVTFTGDLRTVAAEMDSLLVQLQSTAHKTDRVANQLLNENSTFSKLVNERELYDRMLRVVSSADSLIVEIKENPKRFFKFSVF